MDFIDLINFLFTVEGTISFFKYLILFIAVIKIYTTSARTKDIEAELHKLQKINQQLLELLQPEEEPEDEYTEDEFSDDETEIEPYLGDYQGN